MPTLRTGRTKTAQHRLGGPKAPESQKNVADSRRDRKRAADRVAQREHRRRQKKYVEELEAKLEFIKQNTSSDRVTQLLIENENLKEEVRTPNVIVREAYH